MSAPFAVSLFHDVFAKEVTPVDGTLDDLAATIHSTTAPTKAQLPLFKLARFGDTRVPNTQSLRHDQNILACSGIEGDYDGEQISFDEAVKRLLKANIFALVFTTPSHTEERPRWRVVAPTSEEIQPQDRARMMDRLNGALGGILAAESWTLSQSYYYGHVEGAEGFRVEIVDGGECIDCLDELDLTAIGKAAGANGAGAAPRGNGHASVTFDEAALKEAIRTGTGYHESCTRLLGRWAHDGASLMDAEARLFALFDETDPAIRDKRWADRRADVPRTVEGIYGKDARKLDAVDSELAVIKSDIAALQGNDISGATAAVARIAATKLPPLVEEGLIKDIRDQTKLSIKAITKTLNHARRDNRKSDGDDKESQATELVTLAVQSGAVLFHNAANDAFADINLDNHRETWPIRSKSLRSWLTKIYYDKTASAPNSESLSAAVNVLEAMAHFDGKEVPVWLRVGEHEGKIYLDICDTAWRAIEIDADGWRIVTTPPVRFRRTAGMLPLPEPAQNGDIRRLRKLLNVPDNSAFVLAVAFLIGTLNPKGPYADLALNGDHGAAKTSFARTMRDIVDPHSLPPRSLPREDRDLFLAAKNGWLLAFDNVSGLPDWLSDSLCRLSTGGGFATRQLYTDDEEVLFEAMRPVILNGIEDFVVRADLADRSLLLTLKRIEKPVTETELRAKFKEMHPAILGALLNAVSHGLRMLPNTTLEQLPRMADFALWVTACEGALWEQGIFLDAYNANRAEMTETVLEADTVASAVRKLMAGKDSWDGTATVLLETLAFHAPDSERHERKWPKAANALAGRLRRAATGLREIGLDVQFGRTGDAANSKNITITKIVRKTQDRPKIVRKNAWETAAFGRSDDPDAFFPTKTLQGRGRPNADKSVEGAPTLANHANTSAEEAARAHGVPEVAETSSEPSDRPKSPQEPQKIRDLGSDDLRTIPQAADALSELETLRRKWMLNLNNAGPQLPEWVTGR